MKEGEVASNRHVGRRPQTRADGGTGVTFKEMRFSKLVKATKSASESPVNCRQG